MPGLWRLRRGDRPSTSCLCGGMAVSQRPARSYSVRFVFEDSACHGTGLRRTQDRLPRRLTDQVHGTDYAVKKSTAPSGNGNLKEVVSLRGAPAQLPCVRTLDQGFVTAAITQEPVTIPL